MIHTRSVRPDTAEMWSAVLADLPRVNLRGRAVALRPGDVLMVKSAHGEFSGVVIGDTTPIRREFPRAVLLDTSSAEDFAAWASEMPSLAGEERAALEGNQP